MVGPANRNEKGHVASEGRHHPEDRSPVAGEPLLDRAIQARIGDKLRAMYGELTEQPVPDRLVAILDRLGKD